MQKYFIFESFIIQTLFTIVLLTPLVSIVIEELRIVTPPYQQTTLFNPISTSNHNYCFIGLNFTWNCFPVKEILIAENNTFSCFEKVKFILFERSFQK